MINNIVVIIISNLENKKFSYLGKMTLDMKNKIELIKKINKNTGNFFGHKFCRVPWVREY